MYLVDGNNVMGQRPGWHRDRPAAQRRLLLELAELAKLRAVRIAVVFDGRPLPNFPDGSRFRGIDVYFARPGSDADQRILELLEQDPNRRNMTVVTSDRALANLIRGDGVQTMSSGEFRHLLADNASLDRPAGGSTPDAGPEVSVDETPSWMRYFGVDETDSDES
ncbi:MAG: NYN domain-containing protein [Acidobacteriota bacterium]